MSKVLFWMGVVVLLFAADRALLAMESRGWINYRRHGPNLSTARYHMMEMHSIMEPGIQQVIESHYRERKNEDESGDPGGEDDQVEMGHRVSCRKRLDRCMELA